MDVNLYVGPLLVTTAYFVLWYFLLFVLQRGAKYRLKKEYEAEGKVFDRYFGQDEEMLAVDRAVINTQEQMVPFLVSLWLHATFVSITTTSWLGGVYVILRAVYPFLLGKKVSKVQSKRVYIVTLPCYGLIFYLLGSSVWAALG